MKDDISNKSIPGKYHVFRICIIRINPDPITMIVYFFKNMAKLIYLTHHKAENSIFILLNLFLFKALIINIFDNDV